MQAFLANRVEYRHGKKNQKNTSLAYAKLGLIPPGTDLRTGFLKYYASETLAL